jgi:hypothetical protein
MHCERYKQQPTISALIDDHHANDKKKSGNIDERAKENQRPRISVKAVNSAPLAVDYDVACDV